MTFTFVAQKFAVKNFANYDFQVPSLMGLLRVILKDYRDI